MTPLGFWGGLNTYGYVGDNPLMYTDPYGLFGLADLPTLPGWFVNGSAGFGDTLLFGQGQRLRNRLDVSGDVQACSSSYNSGMAVGIFASLADGQGELQFSERVLARMVEEPGAFHNFPVLAAQAALEGEGKMISANYTLYTVDGWINGIPGTYEVGVNSAREITHYFFRPH